MIKDHWGWKKAVRRGLKSTDPLSYHLMSSRTERPDEWKMDEFIRMAEEMEAAIAAVNAETPEDMTVAYFRGLHDGASFEREKVLDRVVRKERGGE